MTRPAIRDHCVRGHGFPIGGFGVMLDHIRNSGLVVQISPSGSEALLLALYKSNLCMLRLNSLRSGASVPRCLAHLVGNAGTVCAMAGSLGSNYISALRYANLRTHVQDSV